MSHARTAVRNANANAERVAKRLANLRAADNGSAQAGRQVTERLKFAELAVAETKKLRLDLTTRSGAEGRYAVGAVAGNMAASTAGQELRCAVKWVDAYKMILMENELDLSAGAPFVHSTHASGWNAW